MKFIVHLVTIIILGINLCTAQQTPAIQIAYDAAGNRISKEQVMILQKEVESEPVKLQTLTKSQCTVKPNPVKQKATVSVQTDITGALVKFTLYTVSGTILFTADGSVGENDIDMAELPNGVYFLRVTIDHEYADLKIVKQE